MTSKANKTANKSIKSNKSISRPFPNRFKSYEEWMSALDFEKELMYLGKIDRKTYLKNIKKINKEINNEPDIQKGK
jgi:hypothetical protein